MIFVATGTQFPFDRLIQYMDEWADQHDEMVFAQLGEGEFHPRNIGWKRFISQDEYNEAIQQASVFISHAGMGNIISAKEHGVPIIVINRQADLGEHRNDHQAEGLAWMGELEGVYAASTQAELFQHIANRHSLNVSNEQNEEHLFELVNYVDSLITEWHK